MTFSWELLKEGFRKVMAFGWFLRNFCRWDRESFPAEGEFEEGLCAFRELYNLFCLCDWGNEGGRQVDSL